MTQCISPLKRSEPHLWRRILLHAAVYALGAAALLIAALLPLRDNAAVNAPPFTLEHYERTLTVYDDDRNETGTVSAAGDFAGYEISRIGACNGILYVNHTPEAFVTPWEDTGVPLAPPAKIERADRLTRAKFGTLQFVFFHLLPQAEDFPAQADALARFRYGEGSSAVVSLQLPFCFDAAAVYCHNNYVFTAGDMGEYSPADYLDNARKREFRPVTVRREPQQIEMTFPLTRKTIPPDRLEAARIVTVHYRAENGVNMADNLPQAGVTNAVRQKARTRTVAHTVYLSVLAAIAIAFGVLAALKHNFYLAGQCGAVWGATLLAAAGLIAQTGRARTQAVLSVLAACLLLSTAIASVALAVLAARKKRKMPDPAAICGAAFALCGALLSLCLPFSPLSFVRPALSVSSLCGAVALWFVFAEFFRTERRNALLSAHLRTEVDAQTATLSAAIADREKILSFLSHDMRKSALAVDALAKEISQNGGNDNAVDAARKIEHKNGVVLQTLSQIAQFAKRNYSDEPFSAVDLSAVFAELTDRIRDDCTANGIRFCAQTKKQRVFAKRNALLSVLYNLVYNAVEHAECTEISVTAHKTNGRVRLCVRDNGKGLADDAQLSSPYASAENESGGLGLFLIRSETESMGGTVEYRTENGSLFILTLDAA